MNSVRTADRFRYLGEVQGPDSLGVIVTCSGAEEESGGGDGSQSLILEHVSKKNATAQTH